VSTTDRPDPQADAYRRAVRLVAHPADDDGLQTVVADLDDDFHRFRVTLRHDGRRVVSVEGEGIRFPWSTCPDAAVPLRALEGAPLSVRATAAADHANPKATCTHMFDLAALAMAHAGAGRAGTRLYEAEIPKRERGHTRARLWRDGELVLDWTVDDRNGVLDAPPYSDAPWQGGFMQWVDANLEPDAAEAAIVLRRAVTIGHGRGMDLDVYDRAEEIAPMMNAICFTFQSPQVEVALRHRGATRDRGATPEALLGDDGK
jgi:Protein of unknown function (DUF2889)